MVVRDKRYFRRYHKVAPFILRVHDEYLQAKIVDYSLEGVGVIVEDTHAFTQGERVNLVLAEPDIETEGTVVWTDPAGSGARIGIRNTGSLRGLIRDFRLTDAIIGLQRAGRTGILAVNSDNTLRKVFFSRGAMVFAISDRPEDTLGEMLFRMGKLTPEQMDLFRAAMRKTDQKEGAVLARLGYLTPRELVPAARQMVEEIITDLFGLGDGSFAFADSPLPEREIIPFRLSVANLLYAGIKKIQDTQHIRRDLPPPTGIITLSTGPVDHFFRDLELDYAGNMIKSCIAGGKPISDVVRDSQLDRAEALKVIYALMSMKIIETADGGSGDGNELSHTDEMPEDAEICELDPAVRAEIEELHGKYEDIGYYGVLGVKQDSPLPEIKAAYYRAAKKFHPDIHFTRADDSIKDMLSDIFSYVYEAYATLSNPARRREYDHAGATKPGRAVSNAEKAREKFGEGKALLRQNRDAEAELILGQAVYFDQKVAEYHYYLGLSLVRQKKFKAAEKAISRALRIEPANVIYITEHGFVFLELGFPIRAKGLFEKALKIAPDTAPALAGLKRVIDMEKAG